MGGWRVRIFAGLLLACVPASAGCSSLIAYSGRDVKGLENKDQVRASFGRPLLAGSDNGCEFEEYRTRRKVSEPELAAAFFILGAETLGIWELGAFPLMVLRASGAAVFGQTVRFEYGSDGKVKDILINGTSMESRAGLP